MPGPKPKPAEKNDGVVARFQTLDVAMKAVLPFVENFEEGHRYWKEDRDTLIKNANDQQFMRTKDVEDLEKKLKCQALEHEKTLDELRYAHEQSLLALSNSNKELLEEHEKLKKELEAQQESSEREARQAQIEFSKKVDSLEQSHKGKDDELQAARKAHAEATKEREDAQLELKTMHMTIGWAPSAQPVSVYLSLAAHRYS